MENVDNPTVNDTVDVKVDAPAANAVPVDIPQELNFDSMTDEEILNFDSSKLTEQYVAEALAKAGNMSEEEVDDVSTQQNINDDYEDSDLDSGVQTNTSNMAPEEFMAALTAPIKADGTEIQLEDPKDIIRLVQMGINYSRKMEAMKKEAPIIEALKEAKLFTPDKVNLAIELLKGNPDAIRSLIQEHNVEIDPLDMDDQSTPYTPANHIPDEQITVFKGVLNDIGLQDGGTEFITSVNTEFDDASKSSLIQYPNLMEELYRNKQSGVYDKIMTELTKRKIINDPSILGLNSIQAYVRIGDMLFANSGQEVDTSAQVEEQASAVKAPVTTRPATNTTKAPTKAPAGVAIPKSVETVPTKKAPITDFSQYTDEQILAMAPQFR